MLVGEVSPDVVAKAQEEMQDYEALMHKVELHAVMTRMDDFIRYASKYWAEGSARFNDEDEQFRRTVLTDCFYLLRMCTLLMHPVVPFGTEKIADYLAFEKETFFSWDSSFENMADLCTQEEATQGWHKVKELPPRTDFFEKHPSQFK